MKPNQYHLFLIAVTGMLLIILGLILFGCTDEPGPQPTGLKLHCVQDEIIPGQTCYFQASFGDTLNGQELSDVDTTFIVGATGKSPRDIECQIKDKYCKLYCFYIDCSYHFIPCRFFITKDGVCLLDKCTNGLIEPVWID